MFIYQLGVRMRRWPKQSVIVTISEHINASLLRFKFFLSPQGLLKGALRTWIFIRRSFVPANYKITNNNQLWYAGSLSGDPILARVCSADMWAVHSWLKYQTLYVAKQPLSNLKAWEAFTHNLPLHLAKVEKQTSEVLKNSEVNILFENQLRPS